MSDLPIQRNKIQLEAVQTRSPVSENLMQQLGGAVNDYLDFNAAYEWKINLGYGGKAPRTAIDGIYIVPWDAEIVQVILYSNVPGPAGVTELDIKYQTTPGGARNSIFSVTPKTAAGSPGSSWIGIGDTLSGFTAPVLTVPNIDAGWGLSCDLLTSMSFGAETCGIWVYLKKRV